MSASADPEYHKHYSRAWRQRQRLAGRCARCGQRSCKPRRMRCQACLDHSRRQRQQREAHKRQTGRCSSCNELSVPGQTLCPEHAARVAQVAMQHYRIARTEGRCTNCNEPVQRALTRCESCSAKNARRQRERRNVRLLNGQCPRCDQKTLPGRKSCAAHLEAMRQYRRKQKEITP